jgi:beta-galactosidase GanA
MEQNQITEHRAPLNPRLPRLWHGADYFPEQWLEQPEVLEEDLRLMKAAGCNVTSVGMFAWSALEPEEGRFRFEWLDHCLERIAAEGLFAILATPSGGRPAWLSQIAGGAAGNAAGAATCTIAPQPLLHRRSTGRKPRHGPAPGQATGPPAL